MIDKGRGPILQLGNPAPDFSVTDIFEREISLSHFRGKKVMIAFFRHVGCPFCNIRANTLKELHPFLQKMGLEMIFFFESPKDLLLANYFHTNLAPVPIISDTNKTWYNHYGIETSRAKSLKSHLLLLLQNVLIAKIKRLPAHWMADDESFDTIPAEFLIDENGVLKKVHYGKSLTDKISTKEMVAFAKSQTTSSTEMLFHSTK